MRNTSPADRDTWAALVRSRREAAGMPKVELGRRLGVDRATIARWEAGTTRPEQSEIVQRFADLFAVDLDEALVAAGLRPAGTYTPPPAPPMDPDVAALLAKLEDPTTTEAVKVQIRTMMRALLELAESQPPRPVRVPRRKAG